MSVAYTALSSWPASSSKLVKTLWLFCEKDAVIRQSWRQTLFSAVGTGSHKHHNFPVWLLCNLIEDEELESQGGRGSRVGALTCVIIWRLNFLFSQQQRKRCFDEMYFRAIFGLFLFSVFLSPFAEELQQNWQREVSVVKVYCGV